MGVPYVGRLRCTKRWKVLAKDEAEQVPLAAERGRLVFELVHEVGELSHATSRVGGPIGNVGLFPGGLADEAQTKRVEGGRLHGYVPHAQALKRQDRALLELFGGVRVERQQDDSLGIHEPAVDGVGRLGHHGRSLARAGRGHHLHTVVEAHHGPCLFRGERSALHPVQQVFAGHQFAVHVGSVERGPCRAVVGFPRCQRALDRLGSRSQSNRHARLF